MLDAEARGAVSIAKPFLRALTRNDLPTVGKLFERAFRVFAASDPADFIDAMTALPCHARETVLWALWLVALGEDSCPAHSDPELKGGVTFDLCAAIVAGDADGADDIIAEGFAHTAPERAARHLIELGATSDHYRDLAGLIWLHLLDLRGYRFD